MANIASLRNEVEQHHICEANASYRRRRCIIEKALPGGRVFFDGVGGAVTEVS